MANGALAAQDAIREDMNTRILRPIARGVLAVRNSLTSAGIALYSFATKK